MNKQEIDKAIEILSSFDGTTDQDLQRAVEMAVPLLQRELKALTQQLNNGWIPVSERLTEVSWENLDPWETCKQDNYCARSCHEEGGCANGCPVPRLYRKLAEYEDLGLSPAEIKELQDQVEVLTDTVNMLSPLMMENFELKKEDREEAFNMIDWGYEVEVME